MPPVRTVRGSEAGTRSLYVPCGGARGVHVHLEQYGLNILDAREQVDAWLGLGIALGLGVGLGLGIGLGLGLGLGIGFGSG